MILTEMKIYSKNIDNKIPLTIIDMIGYFIPNIFIPKTIDYFFFIKNSKRLTFFPSEVGVLFRTPYCFILNKLSELKMDIIFNSVGSHSCQEKISNWQVN